MKNGERKFYCVFVNNGTNVCGTWVEAKDEESAKLAAGFKIQFHFPNVEYTDIIITNKLK